MSDNSTLPVSGGGTEVFANDDIGSVKYPRVKATWGPDGTANDTDVASGKPMPVQLRASTGQSLSDTTGLLISTSQIGTLGQAVMASSQPVVLASDQTSIPVGPLSSNMVSGAITSAMTGTTSTSLVAAPGASLRNYITTIIVSNAHATVGTDVVIQDGSGGTTLLTIPAAAVYGGAVITLPTPLRQPTTNTALYCANVTTGASTKVSAVGYKGA